MPGKKKKKRTKSAKKLKDTSLNECAKCPAACCHDLTIDIKKPRTIGEIEELKWKLNYETVAVYVRNRRWHLLVKGRCRYLGDDDLCTIYEQRDEVCREHNPPHCEWYDDWYDFMFTDPEELDAYLTAERRGKRPKKPTGKWLSKGSGRHRYGTVGSGRKR
jgi:Fe-S-cluster containining protein